MKHLKIFEDFEDIDSICKKYDITNYTINSDGTIDVDGIVNLYDKRLTKLPLKFGKVTGYFDCSSNHRDDNKRLQKHQDKIELKLHRLKPSLLLYETAMRYRHIATMHYR